MPDVIVTLPLSFGLAHWVEEGDPAGEPWSGTEWGFSLGGHPPKIEPSERVYIAHAGRLRGYAPLIRVERVGPRRYALIRGGGAVAVTIPRMISGFRGFRYRDWSREDEIPFPGWGTP